MKCEGRASEGEVASKGEGEDFAAPRREPRRKPALKVEGRIRGFRREGLEGRGGGLRREGEEGASKEGLRKARC